MNWITKFFIITLSYLDSLLVLSHTNRYFQFKFNECSKPIQIPINSLLPHHFRQQRREFRLRSAEQFLAQSHRQDAVGVRSAAEQFEGNPGIRKNGRGLVLQAEQRKG